MKLNNKGSVWVWVVGLAILFTTAVVWIGLRMVIESNMPSAFASVQTTYPDMVNFFNTIFDGFCLVAAAGTFIWMVSSSQTPGGYQ